MHAVDESNWQEKPETKRDLGIEKKKCGLQINPKKKKKKKITPNVGLEPTTFR